jgi:hypothetical protein
MKLYSWTVGVRDHATTGFASSYTEAVAKIKDLFDLYKDQRVDVVHYSVEDPDGVVVLAMDLK